MAGWTGKRVNVAFSKPEEPAFLKRFKERVGYKEDQGMSDKFAKMPEATDEDLDDKDDELPQVVSLRSGDLTQEEYDQLRSEGKLDDLLEEGEGEVQGPKTREEVDAPADGKIIFRKPAKRSGDEKDGKGTEKKQKGEDKNEKREKKSKKEKEKELKKIKLLSFNEDEEEED
ncbi:uncharacterized protein KIAA1143 homolog [Penaeus chinensis]|uniref:uncharacterized protein KIAA1143 homolog n=1 Tax=Penaeus chinensis TaxID=139456 RepID=UPI001FB6FF88|nr:uncharacterized protein KIAA1143 homolog [Penaeus chinensis]